MNNLTLQHLLEYMESTHHQRDEDWCGLHGRMTTGRGDYGIVAEPYTVHLNWLPELTVLPPRDHSMRRRND